MSWERGGAVLIFEDVCVVCGGVGRVFLVNVEGEEGRETGWCLLDRTMLMFKSF